jgi:hypothetical protein
MEAELVVAHRRFIKDGQLLKVCKKKPKARNVFLFSDILIYGTRVESGKYKVHRVIDMKGARVESLPDAARQHSFQILSKSKSFVACAESAAEKQGWLNAIEDVLKHHDAKTDEIAAVWIPDSEAKHCLACNARFTPVRRRHHCRSARRFTARRFTARRFTARRFASLRSVLIDEQGMRKGCVWQVQRVQVGAEQHQFRGEPSVSGMLLKPAAPIASRDRPTAGIQHQQSSHPSFRQAATARHESDPRLIGRAEHLALLTNM